MTTPELSLQGNGWSPSQQPPETAERRVAGWQRALRWVAWLTFLGLAIWNSQSVSFSGLEFVALAAAIGISIFCMAKPLGGPKVDLSEPAHLLGGFVSRTNWALVLIGAILTVGGVAATAAIVYDTSTGRASFGDVVRDIGVFIEGWIAELITRGGHNAELEKTHAYALCILLLPGLLLPSFGSSRTGRSRFVPTPPGPHCWSSSTRSSPPTGRRSSSDRRRGQTRWFFRSSGCSPASTAFGCPPEPARSSSAAD